MKPRCIHGVPGMCPRCAAAWEKDKTSFNLHRYEVTLPEDGPLLYRRVPQYGRRRPGAIPVIEVKNGAKLLSEAP